MDFEKIAQLEGFGEKSASKLKKAIQDAKARPLHKLLHSLSIHHLGKKAAKLIAMEIKSIWDLPEWSEEDYISIKDIGPVVAKNMVAYFSDDENIKVLKELESLGVNVMQSDEDKPLKIDVDAPLLGKTILFTGTLHQMKRKEAQELAAKAGAKNISAVSKNLNILVAGEKAGSKLAKAEKIGNIEILTEEEFLKIIES